MADLAKLVLLPLGTGLGDKLVSFETKTVPEADVGIFPKNWSLVFWLELEIEAFLNSFLAPLVVTKFRLGVGDFMVG